MCTHTLIDLLPLPSLPLPSLPSPLPSPPLPSPSPSRPPLPYLIVYVVVTGIAPHREVREGQCQRVVGLLVVLHHVLVNITAAVDLTRQERGEGSRYTSTT